ncbi:MAG TPA: hypothetical protein VFP45_08025 [Candidatus Nitrosotalea sp.]|nr:hypothetical protein [Candidatus Nitrosotalea sp.]
MKPLYSIPCIVMFSIMIMMICVQNAHAQVADNTLSNSTITAILNQFNPVNQPIPTTSYANPSGCPMPLASNTPGTINKIQCGLYASDPLNNQTATQQQLQENSKYWVYGGDAPAENAPYAYYEDSQGLHIGVQAPSAGTYAGYYAVTPNTNAMLFHAVITSPLRTMPMSNVSENYFQNGLYVQTTQAPVNYVTCVSITNSVATIWAIVHTYGTPFGSVAFDTLWYDASANQPLTRDCTIITNGHNYLKVYLDGAMVYSSNTLALGMPAPFNAFLEPQTSYDGTELFGTYTDFYASSSENAKIINNPSSATTAKVVDDLGNVLVTSPVILGNATIDVGKYHFPLSASVQIFDSNNQQLASTPVTETVYGGDVYSVVSEANATIPTVPSLPNATIPTVPSLPNATVFHLMVNTQSDNGSSLTGYLVLLKQNGITVERGYSPKTFTLVHDQQYTVHPEDYGKYVFDHWSDTNSVNRDRNISISSDTSITAIYKLS